MSINRRLALVLLVVTATLGVIAVRREAARRATRESSRVVAMAAEQSRARMQAEEQVLRAHLSAAAATKPLLAALEDHVDGPTLVDLFGSEDWWRDVRSAFQLSRVILGSEVLATLGALDLGTRDKELVSQARRSNVAAAIITVDGRPYHVVAARLPVLPDKSPVLVLAQVIDHPLAMDTVSPPTTGSLTMVDIGLWIAAILAGIGTVGLLLFPEKPAAAASKSPQDVGSPAIESTLKFGTTTRAKAVSNLPAPGGAAANPKNTVSIRGKVPAPATPPSEGAPVAHSRHPTTPDGTPIASDGSPGQRFGRYQLLNRIGEGGMSEVFTAVATGVEGFSRVFVLKRLRSELSRDKEAVGQFIDEARMQASLVHSNIVPVFDFGRVGDEYFMTQEYIVGRDLTRIMAAYYEHCQQTLDPRLAYYVALETLQALQYAHTRRDKDGQPLGIVHRDVSAGNIILSAQGEVKLADFGIVKSNKRVTKTQVGMVKGNANFMSPEQARGHQVDARSDLFSVGLVLFYALTNRLLYDGGNDLEVLFKAASGPTADFYQQINDLASPARDVLGRALALDPADRFQSAAEFADVLIAHVGGAKADAAQLMQLLFGDELQREAA